MRIPPSRRSSNIYILQTKTLTLRSTQRNRIANASAPTSKCPSAPAETNHTSIRSRIIHYSSKMYVFIRGDADLRMGMHIHQIVLVAHHHQTEVPMAKTLQNLVAHRPAILHQMHVEQTCLFWYCFQFCVYFSFGALSPHLPGTSPDCPCQKPARTRAPSAVRADVRCSIRPNCRPETFSARHTTNTQTRAKVSSEEL